MVRRDGPCPSEGRPPIASFKSGHAPRHEAADRDLVIDPNRPNHCPSRPVRFGNQGIVWNIDPSVLEPNPIMTIFRVPVGICDGFTVRHRTTESLAAREMIEPWLER